MSASSLLDRMGLLSRVTGKDRWLGGAGGSGVAKEKKHGRGQGNFETEMVLPFHEVPRAGQLTHGVLFTHLVVLWSYWLPRLRLQLILYAKGALLGRARTPQNRDTVAPAPGRGPFIE
jgi:hypothetical protein